MENNQEYMQLLHEREVLMSRLDSLGTLTTQARNDARQLDTLHNSAINDSMQSRILDLEQQTFDLRSQHYDIVARINVIEQEWLIAQMFATPENEEEGIVAEGDGIAEGDIVAETTTEIGTQPMGEESTVTEEELNGDSTAIEVVEPVAADLSDIISRGELSQYLRAEDLTELETAFEEQAIMEETTLAYLAKYNEMVATAVAYREATNESDATEIFDRFQELSSEATALSDEMNRLWIHILDTKFYAYSYVLESMRKYDSLDAMGANFTSMLQQCSTEEDYYASNSLMRYAIGYPVLLDYEIIFAREIGREDIAESLTAKRDNLDAIDYRIEPLSLERRLFLDYTPITIGRTNFYNSNNPLPELRIYERGTIYRILLGEFRNRQPMTLFKGVQPLYITQNEEGHYLYYTGGFATRLEADEAQLFLREKGFSAPEICRWRDGQMVNLTAAASDDNDETTVVAGNRYVVTINTDSLSDDLRATIQENAPGKMVSRSGGHFRIGTFSERSEADFLITILSDNYPGLQVSVNEIEL